VKFMFCIMLDENKSLLLYDAVTVKVNDDKGYVSFFDRYGNLISLFRLSEIIGFHEMN